MFRIVYFFVYVFYALCLVLFLGCFFFKKKLICGVGMESVFWRDNSKPCDFPLNRFCLVLWLDEASKHFFKSKVVGYNTSLYFDWNFQTILYYVGVYHILIKGIQKKIIFWSHNTVLFFTVSHVLWTCRIVCELWSWIPTEFLHAEIYTSFVVWAVGINAIKISACV